MSFEEFDKKIREAAEHHHPSYDENAWKGMKSLLDKHLPEEDKDRRRIFFFLLLALLLGVGGFLVLGRSGKKQPATSQVQSAPSGGTEKATSVSPTEDPATGNSRREDKKEAPVSNPHQPDVSADGKSATPVENTVTVADQLQKNRVLKVNLPPAKIQSDLSPVVSRNKQTRKPGKVQPFTLKKKDNLLEKTVRPASNDVAVTGETKSDESNNKKATDMPVTATSHPQPSLPDNKQATAFTRNDTTAAVEPKGAIQPEKPGPVTAAATVVPPEKKKKPSGKKNSFSFSFSTGPDVSYAGGEQWGKTRVVLGLGIGYNMGDRLMIRSGFFTAKKVYDASPKSYNPPQNFYTYYPYLYGVNADCKVYEIPVLFTYRFGRSSKQKGLVTAGLSSYIMKKETYDYTYSYVPSGQLYKHRYSVENENAHWFSVFTLSGGYQRQLGKNISLMAEPYLKLPLNGVGFGKVKLNSAGILFTVGVNPFAKNPGTKKRKPLTN